MVLEKLGRNTGATMVRQVVGNWRIPVGPFIITKSLNAPICQLLCCWCIKEQVMSASQFGLREAPSGKWCNRSIMHQKLHHLSQGSVWCIREPRIGACHTVIYSTGVKSQYGASA
jgi:hypothetical protein